ncbi:MAG: DUF3124 domain-containing protein [Lutibacter sp.]|nr:DUF3124 domain-containing protein [Lutibacter sp.]
MARIILMLCITLTINSCNQKKGISSIHQENWENRTIDFTLNDSLMSGNTYLSVYSQIYSQSEHRTQNLTATVSMRNINLTDTVYVFKATYFDTHGKEIRFYLKKPIFLAPMETAEIVIDEVDKEGGTGANFLFGWKVKKNANEPYFEAVMISTSGQQGLSFTTQGRRIY